MKLFYPNQIEVWDQIVETTDNLKNSARLLLPAQMQVGKTGAQVYSAVQFAVFMKGRNRHFRSMLLLADANNDILEQTKAEVKTGQRDSNIGDLEHSFEVEHRSNLKNILLPPSGDILAFIDEAHLAAGKTTHVSKFIKELEKYRNDGRGTVIIVEVGATSYAHMTVHQTLGNGSPYKVIHLHPGENYNSIKEMFERGRLQKVQEILKDNKLTAFTKERIKELAPGKFGFIRASGKRHDKIVAALQAAKIDVIIANSDKAAADVEAKRLVKYLTNLADQGKTGIVMIKGAWRVGKALKPEFSKHIAWKVDTKHGKGDTVAQSLIGRSCGYGKVEDQYRIYADLKEVQTTIDFFDGVHGAMPSGVKNNGSRKPKGFYRLVTEEDLKRINADKRAGILKNRSHYVSGNKSVDICDVILRNQDRYQGYPIYVDEQCTHKDRKFGDESWAAMQENHPEFIGQWIMYDRGNGDLPYEGAEVKPTFRDAKYLN